MKGITKSVVTDERKPVKGLQGAEVNMDENN